MRKLGWFSCGIASTMACLYEPDAELYYIEIGTAHPDNDRFIADFERVTGRKVNIIHQGKYKDQFEVIEKVRYINGPTGAACTRELKMEARYQVQKPGDANVFGFTVEEYHRFSRQELRHPEFLTLAPLIVRGMTKKMAHDEFKKLGIKEPFIYSLGYKNNNCIGCVKGGQGYWKKIREDFPAYFQKMAELERELNHSCIKGKFLDELPDGAPLFASVPQCSSFCE